MNDTAPTFTPDGLPTLIGSLPMADHRQALELVLTNTGKIPLWPQLPTKPAEGMMVQFIEGIPGVVEQDGRTFYDTGGSDFETEQLGFYEDYLAAVEDFSLLADSRFQVSRERAAGLYLLAEQAPQLADIVALKGQVTGPFTQLTAVKDRQDRLGYYDPTIRDLVVKGLAMKAAWQVMLLKNSRPDLPVMVFIDEPALAGLGSSSFISISLDDIRQDLTEVITAIHQAGGLAGVHVCANTDWNLLLQSEVDVISFDAHGFFDRFITCRDQIHLFLKRGGIIAWGVVPTAGQDIIERETAESLARLWTSQAEQLTVDAWPLPSLLTRTLVTPSCGTGSLSQALAQQVLNLTRDVSAILRQQYLL